MIKGMFYVLWYVILGIALLVLAVFDVAPVSRETLLSLGMASFALSSAFLIHWESRKEAKEANKEIMKELQDIRNDLAEIKRCH